MRKENKISTYIIILVDDIVIAGENQTIEIIINALNNRYDLKDVGNVAHFWGLGKKQNNGYTLNQRLKKRRTFKKT